ncbi:hypothetical protein [Candidatus Vallotiella sp. (ex Adelges kitamiensis)]|uniref:hypothetical protein n=1 Tax=Candidatus Vallotiella sp. (ex Adelges kitamiensis) TaxID=2864217 RepID=UPI001CE2DF34|nr:hypothetical protein [Candidatus Vallotia sp. (ex Adelges kitamiensis)]
MSSALLFGMVISDAHNLVYRLPTKFASYDNIPIVVAQAPGAYLVGFEILL